MKDMGLSYILHKSRAFSFGKFEVENAKRQSRRANTFDFVGFTRYCDKSCKGGFKVGRKTSRSMIKAKCKDMNIWLKSIRNIVKTKEWWKVLRTKSQGQYQYYDVSGNMSSIAQFSAITVRLVRK